MTGIADVHDIEWFSDVPRSIRKHALFGLTLAILAFGGFGTWAAVAPLAAAVMAAGSFVATGENKIVQHLEGGIIQEILVSEGDHVEKDQPLIRLDGTAAQVKARQYFLRQARLEAIVARLQAQVTAQPRLQLPPIVSNNEDDADVKEIIDGQMTAFNSSKARLDSEIGLLRQNIESLEFRAVGFEKQRDSMIEQLAFLRDDYKGKKALLDKGLVRKSEINAIQRAMADAEGQIGRLDAEVLETRSQAKRYEGQVQQTITELKEAALDELQSASTELDTVREQTREARNVLQRATINAPVSGTVVRLYYHTPGGVIESGKKILEILPSDVPLIIEALIQRRDIDAVKIGQKATVRLVALNQRTTPILNGEVYYVSADALADPNLDRAQEVYLARVRLSSHELSRVHGFSPTPGMPVEVMIHSADRTFFDYITKPIRDVMAHAFMER